MTRVGKLAIGFAVMAGAITVLFGAVRLRPRFEQRVHKPRDTTSFLTAPTALERAPDDHGQVAERALLIRNLATIQDLRFGYDPPFGAIAALGKSSNAWSFASIARRAMRLHGVSSDGPAIAWLKEALVQDLEPDPSAIHEIDGEWRTAQAGLDAAPFRLLAIVNRPDLTKFRTCATCTEDQWARGAELRFDFGVAAKTSGTAKNFYVIVEFVLRDMTKESFLQYMSDWMSLARSTKPDFPKRLAMLLDDVLINRVSTARFRLIAQSRVKPSRWPVREYHVAPGSIAVSPLMRQLPAQERCVNGYTSPQLSWWLAQEPNILAVLADQYEYSAGPTNPQCQPRTDSSDVPALRGAAFNFLPQIPFKLGKNVLLAEPHRSAIEKRLALNSCGRCHGDHTENKFAHIRNRERSKQSDLSGFLCGASPCNTVSESYTDSGFNDLLRRHEFILKVLELDPAASDWTTKLQGLTTYQAH